MFPILPPLVQWGSLGEPRLAATPSHQAAAGEGSGTLWLSAVKELDAETRSDHWSL